MHFPYSAEPGDDIGRIQGFASPGEVVSLAFSLHAEADVGEVVMETTDLRDGERSIPSSAVELHVVHVWTQAGVGVYQDAPVRVPELLLKDDRVALRDRYTLRRPGSWRPYRRRLGYVAPAVRLDGDARTSLAASEPKQVWVTVEVPADAPAGRYRGRILVRLPGAAATEAEVALDVEVLPLRLVEPEQDQMLWFKGTLDPRRPQHHLSPARFAGQLRDIHRLGFRSLSLTETAPRELQRAVDLAVDAGFRRDVVLDGAGGDCWERVDFGPLRPVAYVSDEVDAHGPQRAAAHTLRLRQARDSGLTSMASLLHAETAARLTAKGDEPDVISLYLPHNLDYFAFRASFRQLRDRDVRFYWHAHMEKPNLHRLLAGVLLFTSGAGGIAPYCYQHRPQAPFSAFDDFDEWEPGLHIGGDRRAFKDHMATYPARAGSIPTVQWKGMGEGLTDLRYLATFHAALRAARGRRADEIGAHVDKLLDGFPVNEIELLSPTQREPYAGSAPGALHSLREAVARAAVELKELQPARSAGDAPRDAARR